MTELEKSPLYFGMDRKAWEIKLPATQVDNEVVLTNTNAFPALNIEQGSKSPLGVFYSNNFEDTERLMEVDEYFAQASRMGKYGKMIFSDNEGRLYRDITVKGIGGYKRKFNPREKDPKIKLTSVVPPNQKIHPSSLGVGNMWDAVKDVELSERLIKAGVRAPRPVAVLKLKEVVIDTDKKVTVEEAKNKGVLAKNEEPAAYIRAFGVETRMNALNQIRHFTDFDSMIQDAKNFLRYSKLLNSDDDQSYLQYLLGTQAKNVKIMHSLNLIHCNLERGQNFTLDGEMLDFDSLEDVSSDTDIKKAQRLENDFKGAKKAMDSFVKMFFKLRRQPLQETDKERLVEQYFTNIYNTTLL